MTTNGKSGFVTRDRWWIPIVAATALVLLVFAGWHFFKPRPKPTPVPPAPVTATVMFKNGMGHKCTGDLNMILAGKTYSVDVSPYAASGVPEGPQEYSIDGVVSCPGKPPSKAHGSGAIDVREGAVFYMTWQSMQNGTGIVDVVRVEDEASGSAVENGHSSTRPTARPSASQKTGSMHKPSSERPGQEGATPGKGSPQPQRF